ncbi:hypothetical protein GCM10009721_16380 [Terrabacter tumescens]|uniref:Fenitrothion hydrolase n=1 Tax=Terrabacter tumescens TaxID=60443 RepID=A0ABQ2HW28_9MICO|nr:hypothetical protein [Terrabacter tumescens]GGM91490.1 hypothetical protein GCM10009721_16380 [Terrabacter tumescens]
MAPALAPAHGVGSRGDLPLPFTALVIAAVAALVISFVAIGTLWREPRLRDTDGLLLPGPMAALLDSRWLRVVARVLAAALTLWTLTALVLGPDSARNPVPHVVYVWLWVGLAFASMLLGPVWRVINPLRWLHAGLLRLARVSPDLAALPYRWGLWPAAIGLGTFTWVELVAEDNTSLGFLRLLIAGFIAVSLLGAAVFGRTWFDHADPFEAWSRQLGLLSPLGRRPDGRWVLRTPLHGVNGLRGQRGLVPTVAVMLGGTAYDGFSANLSWATFVQTSPVPSSLLRTATLLAFFGLVATTIWLASVVSVRLAGEPFARSFSFVSDIAPSLIPIAGGYVIAHYWSLWVYQGQYAWRLLTDPLGTGADLLGTADLTPNDLLIQPTLVATIQAVSIVVGHLLGVLAAHERAITVLDRRSAVVGQVPLMVVMIFYTLGGLTILFAP